ncbi:MAG: hypothetical protein Q8P72_05545 [Candidatus Roizmanbacteria bacterium]|nr:hypothetical protein [Candidatus Roizmanbacteria bacterium]
MSKREARSFDFGDPSREVDTRLNLLMSREYGQVGAVPMVAGGFGDFYEYLDDVTSSIPHDHPDREKLIVSLTGLGFGGGFKNRSELSPTMTEYFERMGLVGAGAVGDIMKMRGWDGIDLLVVGSSSANVWVPEIITEELGRAGLTIDTFLMNAQACNSSASAINDVCRDPQLNGARVVVLGIESLSGSAVDQQDYITRHTFGNMFGAIGFQQGKDLVHVMGRDTVIEQDRAGVIRAPFAFHAENKGDIGSPVQPPPWYRVEGDIDPNFWHVTTRGNFLNIAVALKLTMDGVATFEYFRSRVPPIELALLTDYYSNWFNTEWNGMKLPRLGATVAHTPSFIVHESKCRAVEQQKRRLAKSEGFPFFDVPQSHWMLDKIGGNNSSAATMLVNMTHMANENMILPGKPFLMEAYGAGSAFSANVMMIR